MLRQCYCENIYLVYIVYNPLESIMYRLVLLTCILHCRGVECLSFRPQEGYCISRTPRAGKKETSNDAIKKRIHTLFFKIPYILRFIFMCVSDMVLGVWIFFHGEGIPSLFSTDFTTLLLKGRLSLSCCQFSLHLTSRVTNY